MRTKSIPELRETTTSAVGVFNSVFFKPDLPGISKLAAAATTPSIAEALQTASGWIKKAGNQLSSIRESQWNRSTMNHKLSPLTDKEGEWVASQIQAASQFVDAFSPADAGQPLTLAALDRAFASWLGTDMTDNELVNGSINCVGIAFGQFLVDGVGLAWVIATDQYGTDLAVHGLPGNGDVLVFPANFVAKRWERREINFLENSYQQIADQVQAVSKANAAPPAGKPWWKFW